MDRVAYSVFEACENGDVEKLSELLAEGCEYMFHDCVGFSPMHAAAERRHLQCVKLLLQAAERDSLSADEVIAKLCQVTDNRYGKTPLSIAAAQGQVEMVELLSTLFSKSTTKPDSGRALIKACIEENVECFHIILKHFPWRIDACERGCSPIEDAVRFGSLESMKLIIEAGADITKGSKNAARALHYACYSGNYDKVKLLLDSGCAVKGCGNIVPLFAATSSATNVKLVKLLLSRGADPCELTEEYIYMLHANAKMTPLAVAASYGNLEIVKILASLTPHSFDPMATFFAASANADDCLQYLFEEGFDTFTSTHFGYSQETLWTAALHLDDNIPIESISTTLKILLENGTKYNELTSGEFCARAFSYIDLEALNLFCAYGLLEMQFDCQNLPRFDKFTELSNSFLKYLTKMSVETYGDNLKDVPEICNSINADYLARIRLLMKYYPFAKFSVGDSADSANLFDFHTGIILSVVPSLVQICSWNIRCSIICKQERLSSKLVRTLKLPPRLEKLIFNSS